MKANVFKHFNLLKIFKQNHIMKCAFPYSTNIPTVHDLKLSSSKQFGRDHGFKPIAPDRTYLLKYTQKFEDLPERSMQDSFLEGLIPLSSDQQLQEKYITFLGHVRIGRLLEDMDLFAVLVANKHIYTPKLPEGVHSPYTLVTAQIDQIDFTDFVPKPNEDIKLAGHVSWVGRSSLEVVVWLEQLLHGTWHKITRSLFLIAARDAVCKKAAVVNPLQPLNDYEKEMLKRGESRKIHRIKSAQEHVWKVIPSVEEQQLIHDLYIKTCGDVTANPVQTGCVPMEQCTISNVIFSHPEDRNIHNTVFGGFIMRHATELAWILGFQFSKYRPFLRSISDITFHSPIAVNSLIQMQGHVVYTHLQYYQIIIFVKILDPIKGESALSNTFHFTFEAPDAVKRVYPKSYHESMLFIDGKRHFDRVMQGHDNNVDDLIDKYTTYFKKNKL